MELKFKFNNELVANENCMTYKELYEGFFNLVFKYINTGIFGSRIDDTGLFLERSITKDPTKGIDGSFISRKRENMNDAGKGNETLPASFLVHERFLIENELLGIDITKDLKDVIGTDVNVEIAKEAIRPLLLNAMYSFMNYLLRDLRVDKEESFEEDELKAALFDFENTDLSNRYGLSYDDSIWNSFDIQKDIAKFVFDMIFKDHSSKLLTYYEDESLRNMEIIRNLFLLEDVLFKLHNRSGLDYEREEQIATPNQQYLSIDIEEGLAAPRDYLLQYDYDSEILDKNKQALKLFSEFGTLHKIDNKELHKIAVMLVFKYGSKLTIDEEDGFAYKKEHGLQAVEDPFSTFKTIAGLFYDNIENVFKINSGLNYQEDHLWTELFRGMVIDSVFSNVSYEEKRSEIIKELMAQTSKNELLKDEFDSNIYADQNGVFYLNEMSSERLGQDKWIGIIQSIWYIASTVGLDVYDLLLDLFKENTKEMSDELDQNVVLQPKEMHIFSDTQIEINEKTTYYADIKDIIMFIKNNRSIEEFEYHIYEKVRKDYKPFAEDIPPYWVQRNFGMYFTEGKWLKFDFDKGIRSSLTIVDENHGWREDPGIFYDRVEEFFSSAGCKSGRPTFVIDHSALKRPDFTSDFLDSNIVITKYTDRDTARFPIHKFFSKGLDDMGLFNALLGVLKSRTKFTDYKDLAKWASKYSRLMNYSISSEFLWKNSRSVHKELEEIFSFKIGEDIAKFKETQFVHKREADIGENKTEIPISQIPRPTMVEDQKIIDKFISRREVGTTILRLLSSFVSKTGAPIGENDTIKFIFKKEWTTRVENEETSYTPNSNPIQFENPDECIWIRFGARPLFSEDDLMEFKVKEAVVLPKPTGQDTWYSFALKSEMQRPVMMDETIFADKKIVGYNIEEKTDIWGDIWREITEHNEQVFSHKDFGTISLAEDDIPFDRKMLLFETDDTAVLIAKKNELETRIQEIELLNQDKIAKSIVTNPELTMRLTDPYQDFFDSYTFSYDELILPDQDFDYGKFKEQLVDENGKPKSPIRTIDGSTFIAKYPVNHPIPKFGDIGREFVEIDGHLMKFMIEILYRIWQENIFKFGAMDMRESVERMIQYMNLFVDTRVPEQLHKQAKRVVQMFRWYGEYAILERGEFKIHVSFKDFVAPLHTGEIGIENTMTNLEVSPKRIVEIINPDSDASVEFTIKNISEAIFKCNLMMTNGTCTIYLNNEIIKETSASIEKVEVTIPTQTDPSKLKVEFKSFGNSTFNISAIRLSNYAYDDITTEYSPKPGLGNAAIDALLKRVSDLTFTLTAEEMAAEVEQMKNGNIAISEMVDKLVQYFNLHHQHKVKGKRLTIKH